jgi:YVTN family beta-propeller protein
MARNNSFGVTYNEGNGDMYVTKHGNDFVSVIDTLHKTVADNITVGFFPLGVAYYSGNGKIYVDNQNDNIVSVIDPSSKAVTATVPVESFPTGVSYNSDNGDIYVNNYIDATVSVIVTLPIVNAGSDQIAQSSHIVTLNGSTAMIQVDLLH